MLQVTAIDSLAAWLSHEPERVEASLLNRGALQKMVSFFSSAQGIIG